MRKVRKTTYLLLTVLFMLSVVLAGCASKTNDAAGTTAVPTTAATMAPASSEAPKLNPVELTWYFDGTPQADVASVETEMNKTLKDKLNVTLHIKTIDWGNFDQKMQVINASGENYDLAFTANWANNYYQNVNKGVFIPLDDLLQKYAPTIMQTIPKIGWDALKVNGKIYAVPNYQIWAMTNGFAVQKELADKYSFKPDGIKKMEDFTPFLEQVKQNNPTMIPFQIDKSGLFSFGSQIVTHGLDEVAGRNIPGTIKLDDSSLKVINQFETDEYKNFLKTTRNWYQKGYIRKDAATLVDSTADAKLGKFAVMPLGNIKPGGEVEILGLNGGKPVYQVTTSKSFLLTSSIISTMTGVSKSSKNPERAVMLLDLLFKDKQLYNLLSHGIEGKHYKKVNDTTVEGIKDSGYDPVTDWEFGNQFNGYYRSGQTPGIWDDTIKINQTAAPSPLLGFNFDPTPVKTEIAQASTVTAQYIPLLETGSVDPDKLLLEFLDKLKKSGSDKIIAEEQKQIDAWKQTVGK